MVAIAKRENNNKRKYLVVNRLQGKHIPVSGKTAFEIFDSLAEKLSDYIKNGEKILIVGFAETATAIGARLAVKLGCRFMQTTREMIPGAEYLYFTESHSHATEQKLVKNDIDSVIGLIDRIIFAEDEVTTGSTIMKIIDIIERLYPGKVKFSVASLLNGMDEEALERYKKKNIEIHYLLKTNHEPFTAIAEGFSGQGVYCEKDESDANCETISVKDNYINTRRLSDGREYDAACEKLSERIISDLGSSIKTAVVIGTEEFMYPALFTAKRLEENGIVSLSHSTTRSPIVTSPEENYPLKKRFQLLSLYDDERTTFVYDLEKYDAAIVITDSANHSAIGLNTLINALRSVGNDNIRVYRWCDNE